jgi:predicted ArsR family transcriptional regulator
MSRSVWRLMISDSGLPQMRRHLLLVVGLYGEGGEQWPTSKQIAEEMSVTQVTVWKHLAALRDQGWLVRVDGRPPRWKPALPAKVTPLFLMEGVG